MDFKLLEKDFEKHHTTRYISTEYNTYHLKWAFEDFEKLLSKPTFQANITVNLDFQLNQDLIHQLDDYIDDLRKFFKKISQSLQKYLSEVDSLDFQMKTYNDFLNNFYKGFKDYVNQGLIPWVYANVMHDFVKQGSLMYEPNPYLEFIFAKFEFKLMQRMRLYLKNISNKLPADQVFPILVNAYNDELIAKQKGIQELKLKSLI